MDHNAPPLNPLPPVVWALALPLIAMEVVLGLEKAGLVGGAASGWRQDAVQRFAFLPDYLRAMIEAGQYPLAGLARLVTYPLVHTDFTHALFVIVILLALGKWVGEIFRWWAVLVVFFGAVVVGALAYAALPWSAGALTGGYPGDYGLIGAFTYILWLRKQRSGGNQLQAFQLIGFLMGFQLLFGLIFGGGWIWVAELSGFFAGFLLSFVVSPGGVARLREKLRQR
ncbi:MAG: rhomboid family intramembrane serine protease [Paracoccaceae bacterium]